jgi:hypothetical protein
VEACTKGQTVQWLDVEGRGGERIVFSVCLFFVFFFPPHRLTQKHAYVFSRSRKSLGAAAGSSFKKRLANLVKKAETSSDESDSLTSSSDGLQGLTPQQADLHREHRDRNAVGIESTDAAWVIPCPHLAHRFIFCFAFLSFFCFFVFFFSALAFIFFFFSPPVVFPLRRRNTYIYILAPRLSMAGSRPVIAVKGRGRAAAARQALRARKTAREAEIESLVTKGKTRIGATASLQQRGFINAAADPEIEADAAVAETLGALLGTPRRARLLDSERKAVLDEAGDKSLANPDVTRRLAGITTPRLGDNTSGGKNKVKASGAGGAGGSSGDLADAAPAAVAAPKRSDTGTSSVGNSSIGSGADSGFGSDSAGDGGVVHGGTHGGGGRGGGGGGGGDAHAGKARTAKDMSYAIDFMMELGVDQLSMLHQEFEAEGAEGLTLMDFILIMRRRLPPNHPISDRDFVASMCELFTEIDLNGDDAVSWDEFSAFVQETASVASDYFRNDDSRRYQLNRHLPDQGVHPFGIERLEYLPEIDRLISLDRDHKLRVYLPSEMRLVETVSTRRTTALAVCYVEVPWSGAYFCFCFGF